MIDIFYEVSDWLWPSCSHMISSHHHMSHVTSHDRGHDSGHLFFSFVSFSRFFRLEGIMFMKTFRIHVNVKVCVLRFFIFVFVSVMSLRPSSFPSCSRRSVVSPVSRCQIKLKLCSMKDRSWQRWCDLPCFCYCHSCHWYSFAETNPPRSRTHVSEIGISMRFRIGWNVYLSECSISACVQHVSTWMQIKTNDIGRAMPERCIVTAWNRLHRLDSSSHQSRSALAYPLRIKPSRWVHFLLDIYPPVCKMDALGYKSKQTASDWWMSVCCTVPTGNGVYRLDSCSLLLFPSSVLLLVYHIPCTMSLLWPSSIRHA